MGPLWGLVCKSQLPEASGAIDIWQPLPGLWRGQTLGISSHLGILSPIPCRMTRQTCAAHLAGEVRATLPNLRSPMCYTLHPTPYTLHPSPYTLHPTPYTNSVAVWATVFVARCAGTP